MTKTKGMQLERERVHLRQGRESTSTVAARAADDWGSSILRKLEWQHLAGQRGDAALRGSRVPDAPAKMPAPVPSPDTASADVADESLDLSNMVAVARAMPTRETEDFGEYLRLKTPSPPPRTTTPVPT